jgi:hypothetical protein
VIALGCTRIYSRKYMNLKPFLHPLAILVLLVNAHTAYAGNDSDDEDQDNQTSALATPGTKIDYANLSADEREVLDNGRISKGQYIAGGIVGTVVGFGLGQAIEGRYMPLGLVFTLGEIGSAFLLASGLANCVDNSVFNYSASSTRNACDNNSAFTVGLIGLVGLHIWEIVDVWASPVKINNRYDRLRAHTNLSSTQFFFTPVNHLASNGAQATGGMLGVQFRF